MILFIVCEEAFIVFCIQPTLNNAEDYVDQNISIENNNPKKNNYEKANRYMDRYKKGSDCFPG